MFPILEKVRLVLSDQEIGALLERDQAHQHSRLFGFILPALLLEGILIGSLWNYAPKRKPA